MWLLDRGILGAGILLLAGFLATLPIVARRVAEDLRAPGERGAPPRERVLAVILAITGLGLAARLLAPDRMVMYYMGYLHVETISSLDHVPKYGPAALLLYRLVFFLTGPSHQVIMDVNNVVGALCPLAGGWLAARLRAPPRAVVFAAAFLAVTPLFIKDSASESLGVPAQLWLLLGLATALRWRDERRVQDAWIAVGCLSLVVFSRPEMLILAPLSVVVLATASGFRRPIRFPVAPLAVAGFLFVARVVHLFLVMRSEVALGNNPNLVERPLLLPVVMLLGTALRNAAFRPTLFPLGLTLAAGVAVALRGRRIPLALAVLHLCGVALSQVDLPYVSIPRVQAPALAFLALAAGLGVERIASAGRKVLWPVLSVVAASMLWTIPTLWQRTNPDEEEDLIREAIAALPRGPVVLARRAYRDDPPERVHLGFPDYLFRPPHRNDDVIGLDQVRARMGSDVPTYVFLGTRCFMRTCGERGMHPACRDALAIPGIEPVIERDVEVRRFPVPYDGWEPRPDQDLDFPWCIPVGETMRIGLYRIAPDPARPAPRTSDELDIAGSGG